MRFLLLPLLLVIAGLVLWRLAGRRFPTRASQQDRTLSQRPSSVRVVPPTAPETAVRTTAVIPPSTLGLDDPDAVRPDLDEHAMASARTLVTPAVPDAVLSDALLDATPEQLQQLFAAVPQDVMANALGDDVSSAPLAENEKVQLSGLSDELDSLDIWDFGTEPGAPDQDHKA